MNAPAHWARMYGSTSLQECFPAYASPSVTAGFMWAPETGPTAYAIVATSNPHVSAMPTSETPPSVSPLTTTTPVPPKMRTNVENHSAISGAWNLPGPTCGTVPLF